MKKSIKIVLIGIVVLFLGFLFIVLSYGYIHGDGGNFEVHENKLNKIVKGQMTKEEIKTMFSNKPPAIITNTPEGEVWRYTRFSSDYNILFHWIEKNKWIKNLDIVFDEKGIVIDCKFSEKKEGVYKNR